MRFAFYLGRRNQEYDFVLCVRGKKEQYRARNLIVEGALRAGCDYIFMLDDDQIIDIDDSMLITHRYDFLRRMIMQMEEKPQIGILGALYYQRDDVDCWPVIMQKNSMGAYFFITHEDVSHRMQKVDVTGGGAMLIRSEIFDRIDSPWFEAESKAGLGTDIQICKKASDAGYEVWCDTSIEIGHTRMEKEIVTSKSIVRRKSVAA
jgi:GT2 family glycosyltransferase